MQVIYLPQGTYKGIGEALGEGINKGVSQGIDVANERAMARYKQELLDKSEEAKERRKQKDLTLTDYAHAYLAQRYLANGEITDEDRAVAARLIAADKGDLTPEEKQKMKIEAAKGVERARLEAQGENLGVIGNISEAKSRGATTGTIKAQAGATGKLSKIEQAKTEGRIIGKREQLQNLKDIEAGLTTARIGATIQERRRLAKTLQETRQIIDSTGKGIKDGKERAAFYKVANDMLARSLVDAQTFGVDSIYNTIGAIKAMAEARGWKAPDIKVTQKGHLFNRQYGATVTYPKLYDTQPVQLGGLGSDWVLIDHGK